MGQPTHGTLKRGHTPNRNKPTQLKLRRPLLQHIVRDGKMAGAKMATRRSAGVHDAAVPMFGATMMVFQEIDARDVGCGNAPICVKYAPDTVPVGDVSNALGSTRTFETSPNSEFTLFETEVFHVYG